MRFEIGAPVYFYHMMGRIPGTIENASKDENGGWFYEIRIGPTMVAKNVPEDDVIERTIVDPPKYRKGDMVRFPGRDTILVGSISIIDAYGTFEQSEEPSYDIFVKGTPGTLYKHVRESEVLGLVEE